MLKLNDKVSVFVGNTFKYCTTVNSSAQMRGGPHIVKTAEGFVFYEKDGSYRDINSYSSLRLATEGDMQADTVNKKREKLQSIAMSSLSQHEVIELYKTASQLGLVN